MSSNVLACCGAPNGSIGPIRRHGPAPQQRLPIGPLLRQLELQVGEWNVRTFARRLGVNAGRLYAGARDGLVVATADRWAVRLGLHPCDVWGEAWWALDGAL